MGAGFAFVRINNYLVDIERNMPAFREVRDRYLVGPTRPASTTIGVPALARPGGLFEIEPSRRCRPDAARNPSLWLLVCCWQGALLASPSLLTGQEPARTGPGTGHSAGLDSAQRIGFPRFKGTAMAKKPAKELAKNRPPKRPPSSPAPTCRIARGHFSNGADVYHGKLQAP
jgi:hypothetical protein